MLDVVLAVIVCPSICPSVTNRYCIKTAKRRIMQTLPRDRSGTVVFCRQQSSVCDAPFSLKFVLEVTHYPFEHNNFDQYPLTVHQPRASKKNSISTNRKSTTRFPTNHRRTVYVTPKSPKCGTKHDFAVFCQ